MKSIRIGSAVVVIALAGVAGCARESGPKPLAAQSFVGPRKVVGETPHSQVDQAGPINYNNVRMDLMDQEPRVQVGEGEQAPPQQSVREVSPTVSESVRPPGERAGGSSPATQPSATAPTAGATTGGYQTIGGVVAEVNGAPIYANKVLEIIGPDLAAKAKDLDLERFRTYAADEIQKATRVLVRDELEFAAAQRLLDSREKDIADQMTGQWRQRQITEAAGSIEVARKRAQEEGTTFEDKVQQQYRLHMTQVYYQKKVIPKIQITADDMRRDYQRNLSNRFTEHDVIQFRLIKIDPKKMGGREQAMAKAKELQERAAKGEDFASLAAAVNHDPFLMKNAGDVGKISRGSFKLSEVEEQVWTLQEDQVTDVIEEDGAYYIASVTDKKVGRVRPFEEQAVQEEIRKTLRADQFKALREKVQVELEKTAIIRTNPDMMNTALEMAMQNYPRWAKA